MSSGLGLQTAAAWDSPAVQVGIGIGILAGFERRLGTENGLIDRSTCPDLSSHKLNGAGRSFTELTIVCNALLADASVSALQMVEYESHKRRLNDIATGRLSLAGDSIFRAGLANVRGNNTLLLSDTVIDAGKFEKGVFTLPENRQSLSVKSLKDLQALSGIIVKSWRVDVDTLQDMGLRSVVFATSPESMVPMMKAHRADFTILEFEQLGTAAWAQGLVRVEGIKVALNASRHIPVSPARPDILNLINGFLMRLKTDTPDFLDELWIRSGFLRPQYANWTRLYP